MKAARPRVRFLGLLEAFLTLSAAGAFLALFSRLHWRLELFSHFAVQYALLLIPAAIAAAVMKLWRPAVLCGVLGLLQVIQVGWALRPVSGGGGGESVSLMLINVYTGNRNYKGISDYILERSPDVLVMLEVDQLWWPRLRAVREAYPHTAQVLRGDNFGIAVLSKTPLEEADTLHLSPIEVPSILARLKVRGRPFTLLATHPLPPTSARYAAERDEQLENAGKMLANLERPVVLAGDLNSTPWSPPFRRLIKASGLKDSRRGIGIQASWPADFPVPLIPLDHVLVSPDIKVLERSLGPALGSDHRIVETRFELPG